MASTLYQLASLAAMADEGLLDDVGRSGETVTRRVLVLADGSQLPELTTPIPEAPGFEALASRFDDVVDLGALVWPRRPRQLNPREEELLLWQRLLRTQWGLGTERVELVLESLQVNPAQALARIFHDSPLSVHADGLMSYGPTRDRLTPSIAQRLDTLVYVDLVPGLRPVYLSEHGIDLVPVPGPALRRVMEDLADQLRPSAVAAELAASGRPCSLVLGQYLVDLKILEPEEQAELDAALVARAVADGAEVVAYKPHPAAGPSGLAGVRETAAEAGVDLVVLPDAAPAELLMIWLRPVSVISCFSTSLFTASALFGLRASAVNTLIVGDRLSPYQNSNRVPVVLAGALLEDPERGLAGDPPRLQGLIDAVAYCMQSLLLPQLRDDAQTFLTAEPLLRDRHVKQRRLRALGLPHAPRPPAEAVGGARGMIERQLGTETTRRAISLARKLRRGPKVTVHRLGQRLVRWSQPTRSSSGGGR